MGERRERERESERETEKGRKCWNLHHFIVNIVLTQNDTSKYVSKGSWQFRCQIRACLFQLNIFNINFHYPKRTQKLLLSL